ncbi:MAG TPA: hypothetical protein VFQ77_04685 [Pseudonocardiaceae bacterium]|jgi:deoxyribonuclease-4|nr:hypothetical protein [Pseudonocardiaceae bacterium]
MQLGAHVDNGNPVGAAAELDAAVVQFFRTDPQSWKTPRPHPQAGQLRAVAQPAAAAAAVGAAGLMVHGGHVTRGENLTEQLVAICAAAATPVVLAARPDSQAEDIAGLREHLRS